jgi:hypothetical protein
MIERSGSRKPKNMRSRICNTAWDPIDVSVLGEDKCVLKPDLLLVSEEVISSLKREWKRSTISYFLFIF